MSKKKKHPDIEPLPHHPVIPPGNPEIVPKPDKNKPEEPLPEITPNPLPEIKPVKGKNKHK